MSKVNGNGNVVTRRKGQHLGYANAYKVVEAIKTHREAFAKSCRSRQQLLDAITAASGVPLNESHLNRLLEIAGVKYRDLVLPADGVRQNIVRHNRDTQTIVRELYVMADSIGHPMSPAFLDLCRRKDIIAAVPDDDDESDRKAMQIVLQHDRATCSS